MPNSRRWRFLGPLPQRRKWVGTRRISLTTRYATANLQMMVAGDAWCQRILLGSDANVQAIDLYLRIGNSPANISGVATIYSDSPTGGVDSSPIPGNLITSQSFSANRLNISGLDDVIRIPLSVPQTLTAGYFWIVIFVDTTNNTYLVRSTPTGIPTGIRQVTASVPTPPPSTFSAIASADSTYADFYAEYYILAVPTTDAATVSLKLTPSGVERKVVFPYFPVIDEFNDASAPRNISTYNSNWTHHIFDGINELATTTDGGVAAPALSISSAYRNDIYGPDGEVYATVLAKPGNGGWIELLARMQNPGNNFNAYILVAFDNSGTDVIEFWKVTNGSFSGTIATLDTAEYNVGDEFGIRFIGNQLSFFKNGVQIGATQTDNSIVGPGYIGLRLTSVSGTGKLDNFGGGRSAVAATDANTVPLLFTPSALEGRETVDAATAAQVLIAIFSYETFFVDTATVKLNFTPSVVEAPVYAESATVPLLFTPSAAEVRERTDSAIGTLTLTASATEIYGRELTDAATANVLFTPSALETREIPDAATTTLLFTPSVVEIREISDSAIGLLIFTPSAIEIREKIDATTASILFTPSAAEIRERTDATTATVLFTPLAAEIAQFVDSTVEVFVLTPSGTDVYVPTTGVIYTDTATIPLTLTPSFVEVLPKVSRKFGLNDKIRLSAGQAAGISGAITCAAIVKLDGARASQWRNLIATANSTPDRYAGGYVFEVTNSNNLMYDTNGGNTPYDDAIAKAPIVHDKWLLVVETKGIENGPPRGHVYDYTTGLWLHAVDHEGSRPNPLAGIATQIELGGDYFGSISWFVGNMAVAGVWNRELTDTEIESLIANLQSWFNLGPKGLWALNQLSPSDAVIDLTGNGANQTSIVGTTVSLDGPVFDYTLDTHAFTDAAEVRLNINIGDPIIKYNVPTILGSSVVKGSALASDTLALTIPADCTGVVVLACGYHNSIPHYLSTGNMTIDGVPLTAYGTDGDITLANTMVACWFYPSPPTGSRTLAWAWPSAATPTDGAVVQAIYLGGTGFVRDSYGKNGNGGYSSQFPYAVNTKIYTITPGDMILAIGEIYNSGAVITYAWDSASTKYEDYATAYRNMTFTVATTRPAANAGVAYWAGDRDFKAITSIQITPPVRPTADSAIVPLLFTPSAVEVFIPLAGVVYTDSATEILVLTPTAVELAVFADTQVVPLALTPSAVELKARELTDANTVPLLLTASAVETAQLVDAATETLIFTVSATEIKARDLTDTNTIPLLLTGAAVEVVVLTDANTAAILFTPSATEFRTQEYVDTATEPLLFTVTAVEVAQLVDANTAAILFTVSGTDVFTPAGVITDANTALIKFTASSTETVAAVDANAEYLLLTAGGIDVLVGVETATVRVLLTISGTETFVPAVVITDSGTEYLTLTISGTELYTPPAVYSDSNSVPLVFSVNGVEAAQFADSNIGRVIFTPSGAEILVPPGIITDAAVVPVLFTITSQQAFFGIDQLIAFVRLSPSGVEIYVPPVILTDAATIYLRLLPSAVELFIPFIAPPKFDPYGVLYRRYEVQLETLVYAAIAFKLYVATCQGQSYSSSIPYRRWWTKYDSTFQGHHRASAG